MKQKGIVNSGISRYCKTVRMIIPVIAVLFIYENVTTGQTNYLKRSLDSIPEVKMEITTGTAHYFPVFGTGDKNSNIVTGIESYGYLRIDPGGNSGFVTLSGREQVFFVLEGTGLLNYGKEEVPVSKNDFVYLPSGIKSRFVNPRERPLCLLMMAFKIQPGNKVRPVEKMMIANADEVPFQVLGSHGPTTQFQLLMGTSESKRDRIAAACQVTSLFIMDFAADGTNIPHRHEKEEEIYFILRGKGDIVAGETNNGKEKRIPSLKGDIFFYSPKTLIGFYSANKEGEDHARILAVRFTYP